MGEYYRSFVSNYKISQKDFFDGASFSDLRWNACGSAGRLWTPEQEKRFQKNFVKKFVQRVIGELQRASIRVCTTQGGHDDFFKRPHPRATDAEIVVPARTRDFS